MRHLTWPSPGPELIWTKLVPPAPRPGLIARTGLQSLLEAGLEAKLCLLDAPAGSGRTTLLTQWCATAGAARVAWVSLDDGDNDPTRLWISIGEALRRDEPAVGVAALQAPPPHQRGPPAGRCYSSRPPATATATFRELRPCSSVPASWLSSWPIPGCFPNCSGRAGGCWIWGPAAGPKWPRPHRAGAGGPAAAAHPAVDPRDRRELYVSVNTVRSQVQAIDRKLEVTSRAEAVLQACRLGLLPASNPRDGGHFT
jgi:hypothetical protein